MHSRFFAIVAVLGLLLIAVAFAQDPADGQATPSAVEPAPVEKAPVSDTAASLARLAICTSVEERTPIGESDSFPADIGKLWCFSKVVNADAPTTVFHRWYVGDTLVNEIPINVGGASWRCWSEKTILSNWSGTCRVEIVTEEGEVLGTKEFVLTAPADDAASGSEG